jgi:hypothetical protein
VARILARILVGTLAAILLLAAGVWWIVRPAEPLALGPPLGVLADVTVVNPGLERRPHQRLVIRDGRVAEITDATVGVRESDAMARYAGATVLPGLIDMHAHFAPIDRDLFSILFLRYGVTTVRVPGNLGRSLLPMRQSVRDGEVAAPRIFTCGPLVDGDPPAQPNSIVVRDADEAHAVVDELAGQGVDCIKVYNNLQLEALAGIRESAAGHGIPVIGHLPASVPFEEAGLADVQHLSGVGDGPLRVPADLPDWFAMQEEGWERMDAARIAAVVDASRRGGVAHTPTLVAAAQLARQLDPEAQPSSAAARLLPRYYRDALWRRGMILLTSMPVEHRVAGMPRFVEALYRGGVRIHLGTDTPNPYVVPGLSAQEELEQFVRAGLTPEEAWVTGTRWPGEFLGVPGLGTIARDAPADLLVFRRDPTRDLTALGTLEAVVAAGRLYPVEAMEEALARQRRRFESGLFDSLTVRFADTALELLGMPPMPQD